MLKAMHARPSSESQKLDLMPLADICTLVYVKNTGMAWLVLQHCVQQATVVGLALAGVRDEVCHLYILSPMWLTASIYHRRPHGHHDQARPYGDRYDGIWKTFSRARGSAPASCRRVSRLPAG